MSQIRKISCISRRTIWRKPCLETSDEISHILYSGQPSECGISPQKNQIGGGGLPLKSNQTDGDFMFGRVPSFFLQSIFLRSLDNSGIYSSLPLSVDGYKIMSFMARLDLVRAPSKQADGCSLGEKNVKPRVLVCGLLLGVRNGLPLCVLSINRLDSLHRLLVVKWFWAMDDPILMRTNVRKDLLAEPFHDQIIWAVKVVKHSNSIRLVYLWRVAYDDRAASMAIREFRIRMDKVFRPADVFGIWLEYYALLLSKYRLCSFSAYDLPVVADGEINLDRNSVVSRVHIHTYQVGNHIRPLPNHLF